MITVGIKDLKARLSSYIDMVIKGERVVITEHGKEVALLVPISEERKAARAIIEEKKARWSGNKPSGTKRVAIKGKPLSETILEDRR